MAVDTFHRPEEQGLLETLMKENREFSPSPEFVKHAWVKDQTPYPEAEKDFKSFWARHAEAELDWFQKWDQVPDDSNKPFYRWFVGVQKTFHLTVSTDMPIPGGARKRPSSGRENRAIHGPLHISSFPQKSKSWRTRLIAWV